MPANRSRTERWRDSLWQVYERSGALEIAIRDQPSRAGADSSPGGPDLLWRVKLMNLSEREIHVEQPCAAGHMIPLEPGVKLIGALSIGQNRWMFHTTVLGTVALQSPGRPAPLRLAMPETVERCLRRSFYRITTAELSLPSVECWPLLCPTSAVAAEVANRAQIIERLRARRSRAVVESSDDVLILPDVGPGFQSRLMNLGGGGIGLVTNRDDASALERCRYVWLRVDLTPQIPLPLGVTGRLVHTHIDSGQNVYAGIAFDWSFNTAHRDFVIDQIAGYMATLQHRQLIAA